MRQLFFILVLLASFSADSFAVNAPTESVRPNAALSNPGAASKGLSPGLFASAGQQKKMPHLVTATPVVNASNRLMSCLNYLRSPIIRLTRTAMPSVRSCLPEPLHAQVIRNLILITLLPAATGYRCVCGVVLHSITS